MRTALARVCTPALLAVVAGCGADDPLSDAGPPGSASEPPELSGTLAAHNQVRAQVGLPALTWDPALAAVAKTWAARCIDVQDPIGLVDHNEGRSTGGAYVGENIYGSSGSATGPAAVASWASEAANYNYASNTCSDVCGHYTQLVWRETTKVGCALQDCARLQYGRTVVCNYAPGGNINSRRPY
ncbi:MAG: Fis family transcriptional regulator [Myxococcales bacterium]|nr:Fis family transcriptional regulator [Myxococcales bacterium]